MGRRLLTMYFGVVTLFPEMFDAVTKSGVTRRACENGLIKVECFNPRTYTLDKFHNVDDKPYGGGPGMLMRFSHCVMQFMQLKKQHLKELK